MKSFFIAHPAKGTGSVTKRLLSSPASKAYGNASCYGIDASCAHRLHLLEDSATSLLLVSCTEWCAGQGCPATFLLRFLPTYPHEDHIPSNLVVAGLRPCLWS